MDDGRILAAHCDCMAGLGETCSHVASLLWVIGVGVESRESLTVTQKSAYWVMPPAMKSVPYSPVKDIEFVGKKRKNSEVSISIPAAKRNIPPPSSTELSQFFDSLASCSDAKPAVLAVVSPYCDAYVPSSLAPELPMVLSDLYRTEYLSLGYHRLLEIAENTEINITANQGRAAEAGTRNQANSRLWFRMRCGRITASKFKSACHTDPASPSISLIMAICYPEACRFSTSATRWGCQHEKVALERYTTCSQSKHKNLKVSKCGLFISVEHPFIGASPDGTVECLCCGQGICEVKVSVHPIFWLTQNEFNAILIIYFMHAVPLLS